MAEAHNLVQAWFDSAIRYSIKNAPPWQQWSVRRASPLRLLRLRAATGHRAMKGRKVPEQWWCLQDAICTATLAGAGSACIALCRRLSKAESHSPLVTEIRTTIGGCGLAGGLAWSATLFFSGVYPGHPLPVLGAVVFSFAIVDPTTAKGRQWLRLRLQSLSSMAMDTLAEMLKRRSGSGGRKGTDDDS